MNQVANIKTGGFALAPSNMAEAMKLAEMLAHSEMVPKQYKGKPQDTLVAMMMGHELGLNPLQSLQNIANINGKPSIYGDAALALVQSHPAFGGIEETFDEPTMTATCTAWRRGGARHTQTFSQADATKAGLWGKSGPWQQYPKRMLQMRARGFALRDTFADALAGLILREEAQDMPPEIDVTPSLASATQREQAPAQTYPQDQFEVNFPKWKDLIGRSRKSAADIIAAVESGGKPLTAEQRKKINDCTPIEGQTIQEGDAQ